VADRFVAPSGAEILEALGVSVFCVLSDMPWSFEVVAGSGETVKVWVTEHPDRVDIDVAAFADGDLTFAGTREGATGLAVSEHAPQIVVESAFGPQVGRLEISLTPRLAIRDTLRGRAD
jgi:hypothetical protein